ncbi:helix-turn-helix domain-containing protein [Nonomuraea indica]|uniref:helix-turn-helix domain-containing protein n=1 Tax=Nonomuraea indica TaxID=1581193 RepID=UPI000C7BA0E5|nr:TetR/AcrR family transcriptional regulator [Nonomuraea indica]
MARITRAESQERNRARILAAARAEFAERGFGDVRIDDIAERAELTRGAVYSNFPGKRALFFAALADRPAPGPALPDRPALDLPAADRPALDQAASDRPVGGGRGRGADGTVRGALGAVARSWMDQVVAGGVADVRPGTGGDRAVSGRMERDLLPLVQAEESSRQAYAQLMTVHATLFGLALERLGDARGRRLVRVAGAALTLLQGAAELAAVSPELVRPADVVSACERLADLDFGPGPLTPPARVRPYPVDLPWAPPPVAEALRGAPAGLGGDGLVVFLGLRRLSALEDVLRAVPPDAPVAAVAVTGDPAELGPLARLVLARLGDHLRPAVPPAAWPPVRVVVDDLGAVAAAAGLPSPGDDTETAVRVSGGRLAARADGRCAGHVLATHPYGEGPDGRMDDGPDGRMNDGPDGRVGRGTGEGGPR